MKKSTIMLLIGALFIFVLMLSTIIFFRYQAGKFIEKSSDNSSIIAASGVLETKEYKFRNFDSLYFENMWDVVITGSNRYYIKVEADKNLLAMISVTQDGETVIFDYDGYLKDRTDRSGDVVVRIGMPDLENLEFTGMGNINLNNFDLDSLEIKNSGASNITGSDISIEDLHLVVNGAANAELDNYRIKNCELDISGAAMIDLRMDGGILSGQVSGAASVTYSGTVSKESVHVWGIGSLEHK